MMYVLVGVQKCSLRAMKSAQHPRETSSSCILVFLKLSVCQKVSRTEVSQGCDSPRSEWCLSNEPQQLAFSLCGWVCGLWLDWECHKSEIVDRNSGFY